MSLSRIKINNYKSIKECDIPITNISLLIGENGTGKSNIIEAVHYFYSNIDEYNQKIDVFDKNNRFSNEVRISLYFDMNKLVNIAKSQITKFSNHMGFYNKILQLTQKTKIIKLEMRQIKQKTIKWNYNYKDRTFLAGLFPLFYIDTRTINLNSWLEIWDVIGDLSKIAHAERIELHNKLKEILDNTENEIAIKINSIKKILDDSQISIYKTKPRDYAKCIAQIYFEAIPLSVRGMD